MDSINNRIKFQQAIYEKLDKLSKEVMEEKTEHLVSSLSWINSKVAFDLNISKEHWDPKMIIDSLDKILSEGTLRCNTEGSCSNFATHIHDQKYFCEHHSGLVDDSKPIRSKFEDIKSDICSIHKALFKVLSIYKFNLSYSNQNCEESKDGDNYQHQIWIRIVQELDKLCKDTPKDQAIMQKFKISLLESQISIIKRMIDDMMKELVQTLTRYISDSYLKTLLEDYQEEQAEEFKDDESYINPKVEKTYSLCSFAALNNKTVSEAEKSIEDVVRSQKEIKKLLDTIAQEIEQNNSDLTKEQKLENRVECRNCGIYEVIDYTKNFKVNENSTSIFIPKKSRKCSCITTLIFYICMYLLFKFIGEPIAQKAVDSTYQIGYKIYDIILHYQENKMKDAILQLSKTGILKIENDNIFIDINLHSNITALNLLKSASIPLVKSISISDHDCRKEVLDFLNKNSIQNIEKLSFKTGSYNLAQISCYTDGFSRTAAKVNNTISILGFITDAAFYKNLISKMDHSKSLILILNNVKMNLDRPIQAIQTRRPSIYSIIIDNCLKTNEWNKDQSSLLIFLESIGNSFDTSSLNKIIFKDIYTFTQKEEIKNKIYSFSKNVYILFE